MEHGTHSGQTLIGIAPKYIVRTLFSYLLIENPKLKPNCSAQYKPLIEPMLIVTIPENQAK